MAFIENSNILVLEKGGQIPLISNGMLQGKPVLQVPIATESERGLLVIAIMSYAQGNPLLGYTPSPLFDDSTLGQSALGHSNATLQIHSNTDWSGSYGDSTGSTTVEGHGNRDIIFSCSDTYSAFFRKKGEGQGEFLTLNIVQPFKDIVTTYQEITKYGIPLAIGRSISLTKQITDLLDSLSLPIMTV